MSGSERYGGVHWDGAAGPPGGAAPGVAPVRLDVWADFACPLCYLELPELRRLGRAAGVEVLFHPFELCPAPAPMAEPDGDAVRRAWARTVYPMAEARRHPLRRPSLRPRSRLAAEAAEFAREAGRFAGMQERLFAAFLRHGRDIGQAPVLVDVGVACGLDGRALRQALECGRYTSRVLQSGRRAVSMGVTDVPAMVVSGPAGVQLVTGAQPYDTLWRVVEVVRGGPLEAPGGWKRPEA